MHQQVLEKIIAKERFELIIALLLIVVALALLWIVPYRHYRKMKEKTREKKRKEIQKSLLGQLILTAILLAFAWLSCWGFRDTYRNIRLDIQEQAYQSYTGEVELHSSHSTKGRLYKSHQSVWLDNGEFVFVYINNLWEDLTRDVGTYDAKLVYGRHSRYVVYMELSE